jgi:hypothetical protein
MAGRGGGRPVTEMNSVFPPRRPGASVGGSGTSRVATSGTPGAAPNGISCTAMSRRGALSGLFWPYWSQYGVAAARYRDQKLRNDPVTRLLTPTSAPGSMGSSSRRYRHGPFTGTAQTPAPASHRPGPTWRPCPRSGSGQPQPRPTRRPCPRSGTAHPPARPTHRHCPPTGLAHPPALPTLRPCPPSGTAHPPALPTLRHGPPAGTAHPPATGIAPHQPRPTVPGGGPGSWSWRRPPRPASYPRRP